MSASTTFQTQITAIMEVLAKAAIAEISKLVEDDHVVIRLEMCRRENEIETLKKRLFFTERDLRKAQRAAIRVIPERVSVGIQAESAGDEYPLVNSNTVTQDTVPKEEEKTSIEDQMTPFIHDGDREMLHNLPPPTHNSGDIIGSDFALKREPEEVRLGQTTSLADCEHRSTGIQSGGGAIDSLAQSWPSFDETHCQVEDEDPGCSYNTEQNSSSDAHLFAVGPEDGSRDFPEDLHLDLFNSVSVKEEGGCMSISQNFPDAVGQSKDGHPKDTVDMAAVQPQTHSVPRTDKGSTSYSLNMATHPTVASHGRPTFIPTDSQTHPTHAALGSHIHTSQISSHSQAPTNSHTPSPYTHSLPASRHLVMRPRTPGLMHRRSGMGMSASSHHRVFICSLCGKSYPRFCQLEAHQRSHTGVKPYRCTECGKRFTQKTRLKTHQSVHTGERPFSCRLCGKRFNRQDNCLRHERFHRAKNPSSRLSMGRGLSS
ncbi:zinc finger and SCAN domain-containing protein 2-like [Sardina pilchardus]|uniref:zinc finger and SCAN domain-containing protein 2-like n=1 Tax=Sardina pilchardus TaxID=27697 RepID=UPI002E12770A